MATSHQQVKVAAAAYPPFVDVCSLETLNPSAECPYPGLDAQLFGYLLDYARLNYSLIPFYPGEFTWGRLNGTWTGLLGQLQNGEIHAISVSWALRADRTKDFSFSYPLRQMRYSFLVRKREASAGETAGFLTEIFSPNLWVTILAGLIACWMAVSVSQNLLYRFYPANVDRGGFSGWIRLFLQHSGDDMWLGGVSTKILFLCMSLLSLFVMSMYQSCLLARLLIPRSVPPFMDANELISLIQRKEYRLVSHGFCGLWDIFGDSTL